MTPSVIPPFDSPHHGQTSFAGRATAAPAAVNSQMIVDALAFSDTLQSATGLDRTSLASLLGANWTPELASRVRCESITLSSLECRLLTTVTLHSLIFCLSVR